MTNTTLSSTFIVYFSLLIFSFIGSFLPQYFKSFKMLRWLLGCEVLVEIVATILKTKFGISPYIAYHFSLPVQYALTAVFFSRLTKDNLIKKIIWISVLVFLVLCVWLSGFYYSIEVFPGIQMNILSVLVAAMSLYALLTLEPEQNIPIFKHPVAWVTFGYIIYYAGSLLFHGVLNRLIENHNTQRSLLHHIFNNGSNMVMYGCYLIAFYFSYRLKNNQRIHL